MWGREPVLEVPAKPSQPMTSPARMSSTISSNDWGRGGGGGWKWVRETRSCKVWPSCSRMVGRAQWLWKQNKQIYLLQIQEDEALACSPDAGHPPHQPLAQIVTGERFAARRGVPDLYCGPTSSRAPLEPRMLLCKSQYWRREWDGRYT